MGQPNEIKANSFEANQFVSAALAETGIQKFQYARPNSTLEFVVLPFYIFR